jgi:gamma-glutamylcyclotransferase (GGCT)/AIG2-like uncharacterized protein YtfP
MATRLATYGSLAPGRANHLQLAGLKGQWFKAIVRGDLIQAGWGADLGFPGLVLDPTGGTVEVDVFEAVDLSEHWGRLDAFEGEGYRRVLAQVETANGIIDAWIYVLA